MQPERKIKRFLSVFRGITGVGGPNLRFVVTNSRFAAMNLELAATLVELAALLVELACVKLAGVSINSRSIRANL
jgi:hypothetical protein